MSILFTASGKIIGLVAGLFFEPASWVCTGLGTRSCCVRSCEGCAAAASFARMKRAWRRGTRVVFSHRTLIGHGPTL
ncbi:hypothetical protein BKA62DRAFT_694053 [Auriculariales sp. MPI-PUGE-AT-0066]|nr:hypothetical protein BKA62DRAFT_694053 [Auriculariales sp. MPI-PUGE-AT-0066]